MKRTVFLASLTVGCLLLTGCGKDAGPLETAWYVTGDSGANADVTITSAKDPEGSGGDRVPAKGAKLPYSDSGIAWRGETTLEAIPSQGALTCRIVVEGKEIVKVTGKAGEKVRCAGTVE